MQVVTSLEIPQLKKIATGKVREIFDLGESFLFVATDRISAFDCILPTGIPSKGRVLTQLSEFWFKLLGNDVKHHLISTRFEDLPSELSGYREVLDGRFMIVRKLEMVPVECVVRGYLVGSGYKEYTRDGAVCGITLPKGMRLAQKLDEPIFTPARKATEGHDENISFQAMKDMVGVDLSEKLRDLSISIYEKAATHARERGIMIADTKFEFGLLDGEIVLGDEVLTPDSSRYWPRDSYVVGENPPSFDKQYVRDWLSGLDWNKQPPAPALPDEVVKVTSEKYLTCFQRLVEGS